MIKGAQKRMIVVKTGDSAVFEEVYFVMRPHSCREQLDMLAEANKIIENCDGSKRRGAGTRARNLIISLVAFLCGGAFGGALALIISALC